MAGLGSECYVQECGYPDTDTGQFVGDLGRRVLCTMGYLRMTTHRVIQD